MFQDGSLDPPPFAVFWNQEVVGIGVLRLRKRIRIRESACSAQDDTLNICRELVGLRANRPAGEGRARSADPNTRLASAQLDGDGGR